MRLLRAKSFSERILSLVKLDRFSCLFFFALAVVLRGIPELLVPVYPVGYETITYYAPAILAFPSKGLGDVFVETFQVGPLFYLFMWLVSALSNAHAFLLLKLAGPVLYGCLVVSFYVFLRRGLNLDWKLAFVAGLVLVFQPAALRESWDRFRTVLGLVFVFLGLTALKSNYRFRWSLVGVLGVLAALSREYVGVVFFAAVLGYAVLERKDRLVSLIALAPALVVFAVMSFPLWSLYNYLSSQNHFAAGGYLWMVQDAFSIFLVCYLPILVFVVKGFWRNRLLLPFVGLLALGSFSFIVSPWFAVPGYQRWLMLLVFPFSIYTAKGLERWGLFAKQRLRVMTAVLLVLVIVGVGYSSGVISYGWWLPNSYVAGDLVKSSIPWDQIEDVKAVLKWLDNNAPANSFVLAEERFYGWTLIYMKRANIDIDVTPFSAHSPVWGCTAALERALDNGFQQIWMVWLTHSDYNDFNLVYSQNSVSIFQYKVNVEYAPFRCEVKRDND